MGRDLFLLKCFDLQTPDENSRTFPSQLMIFEFVCHDIGYL